MRCFVIMPYGSQTDPQQKQELDSFYHELIKPAVESIPLPGRADEFVSCHRADMEPQPGEIVMHIIENLVLSEIAIADLTRRNPNVFYELGVRHAVNDNTILLAQSEDDIPFDLRGQRYFVYCRDFAGAMRLRTFLVTAIQQIIQLPGRVDNPVRRFLFNQEREKIESAGRPPGYDFVHDLLREVTTLRTEFKTQLDEFRTVLKAVTSEKRQLGEVDQQLPDLRLAEGVWVANPSGSYIYPRLIEGELDAPYCYGGKNELTGHYYNFRRIGDKLFARFAWFESSICGYTVLHIRSQDELAGGWWFDVDVPQEIVDDITKMDHSIPGMNPITLTRLKDAEAPDWVERYFRERRSQ